MAGVNYVPQQDQSDCGIACLFSVIKYHGGTSTFEHLRRLSGTTKQGTTLLGLKQAAENIGFEADGLEAENVYSLNEVVNPAILHVVLGGQQHYMVYWPDPNIEKKSQIILTDPAHGIVKLTFDALDKIWITKALLSLTPNENFKTSIPQNEKIGWILNLVRADFNILLVSLFLGIVIAILNLSTALFSQKLIDSILPSGNINKLLVSLTLVTLLLLLRNSLGYLRGQLMVQQSADFNARIINWFYSKLLQLPKSFFDTRKTGDLIARMHDTRRIQSVLSVISGSVVIDLLVIATSLAFIFAYSTFIGCILLGCLPVYLIILFTFHKPIVAAQKETMAGYAMAESNFVDSMQGIADIKLTNQQSFFEQLNARVYGEFQNRVKQLGNINIRFGLVSEVTGTVFMVSVFGAASWLVLSKEMLMGEMVALLGMAGGVIPSVNRLVVANIQIQEAIVAFDRMFEFTSVEKEKACAEISDDLKPTVLSILNALGLERVSFRFPSRRQTLKNISFQTVKGELVCLLGESGQGKSTLIQILQKFYAPESGRILVDGISLDKIGTSEWREQLGSVPQEPKIFNGSLLYNISLSDIPEILKQAIAFCEETGFGKYFNELPQSYLSLVGEEGINLSGGQKQLVALARALFRKPKLLLLDEPTSSMDKMMEEFVMGLLLKEKHERITILVTHREEPAKQCDKIIVLQNGTIQ